jgi:hypothetical protein
MKKTPTIGMITAWMGMVHDVHGHDTCLFFDWEDIMIQTRRLAFSVWRLGEGRKNNCTLPVIYHDTITSSIG